MEQSLRWLHQCDGRRGATSCSYLTCSKPRISDPFGTDSWPISSMRTKWSCRAIGKSDRIIREVLSKVHCSILSSKKSREQLANSCKQDLTLLYGVDVVQNDICSFQQKACAIVITKLLVQPTYYAVRDFTSRRKLFEEKPADDEIDDHRDSGLVWVKWLHLRFTRKEQCLLSSSSCESSGEDGSIRFLWSWSVYVGCGILSSSVGWWTRSRPTGSWVGGDSTGFLM